jgi:hypothetical protein
MDILKKTRATALYGAIPLGRRYAKKIEKR